MRPREERSCSSAAGGRPRGSSGGSARGRDMREEGGLANPGLELDF
eukprot:SAG11_NODE_38267_length_253_cov_0.662338_1_plen_45_part_10